jgi:threonine/homoserine/homoserine lactone efflux protein
MLLIASRSVSQGRSAGFASLAGILAGTYCHALAAAFGLFQLFILVPLAYDAVRYAGAAYLLYLAWQALCANGVVPSRQAPVARISAAIIFRQGLITNLLNPKMALFVLALFPQFASPEKGSFAVQFLILATVLNLIGLTVNSLVILTASRIGSALSGKSRFRRASQILLASVFAGLAARLAFGSRS